MWILQQYQTLLRELFEHNEIAFWPHQCVNIIDQLLHCQEIVENKKT